jgi:hypothetical protein
VNEENALAVGVLPVLPTARRIMPSVLKHYCCNVGRPEVARQRFAPTACIVPF